MSSPLALHLVQQHLQTFERAQMDENSLVKTELSKFKSELSSLSKWTTSRVDPLSEDVGKLTRSVEMLRSDVTSSRSESALGLAQLSTKIDSVKADMRRDLINSDGEHVRQLSQEILKSESSVSQKVDELSHNLRFQKKDLQRKATGLANTDLDIYSISSRIESSLKDLDQKVDQHHQEMSSRFTRLEQTQTAMLSVLQDISSRISAPSQ